MDAKEYPHVLTKSEREFLETLTVQERKDMVRSSLHAALNKMSTVERRDVLASTEYTRESIAMIAKLNGVRQQRLGDDNVLELVGMVGAWMNQSEENQAMDETIEELKKEKAYSETVVK
jgi:hypothetical protein